MKRMIAAIYACAALAVMPASQASEPVDIYLSHLPPYTDAEGGESIVGNLWPLWQRELEGLTLQARWTSKARLIVAMQQQEAACSAMLMKTPARESFAYYSLPLVIVPQQTLVMRRATYEALGEPEALPINQLIDQAELTGAVIENHAYLPSIASQAQRLIGAPQTITLPDTSLLARSELLRRERIDYFIEFNAYLSRDNIFRQYPELVAVAIDQVSPVAYTYLTCSKNAWGAAVIEQFNQALSALYQDEDYLNAMLSLQGMQNSSELIQAHYLLLQQKATDMRLAEE